MKDQNLLALVTRASKEADQNAFVEICNLKAREVIFLCSRQMGNPHDGDDAAQEVFIRMQKSITDLQAPEAFNVWLNRLIHTTCANMRRNSMKHISAVPIEALDESLLDDSEISLPQEYAENAEKRRVLAALIDELPDKYRSCILLHYYQHLSYAQIADVLGQSQDAVNNNMRMARKVLKLELENEVAQQDTKLWSVASMVALGPAITASLQEAATLAVGPSAISHCLTSVGIPALLGAGGLAVAAGAAATGASLHTGAGAGKVLAQIAVAVVLVVGGGVLAFKALNPAAPPAAVPASVMQPAPVAPAANAPLLSGRVYLAGEEPGSQSGYSGAQLQLVDAQNPSEIIKTVTTGADGTFAFLALPPGEYQLLLTLPEGATVVETATTALADGAGQAATVLVQGENTLALDPASPLDGVDIAIVLPTRLQGDVVLQQNGQPVAYDSRLMSGARMDLLDEQGQLVATTSIDETGHYVFEDLPITERGSYSICIVTDSTTGNPVSTEVTSVELYPGFRN